MAKCETYNNQFSRFDVHLINLRFKKSISLNTCLGILGQWELTDIGHKEYKEVLLCFGSTGQKQKTREKQGEREKGEKQSLSSHPHYVNEVHDCSVGPSRVNYQWLLSLIG